MLQGKTIILRPATFTDSRAIYEWLAHSDLTASMMGPPLFPEVSIPSWEEFCVGYPSHFFDGSRSDSGRSYIIELKGEPIGHINYDGLDPKGRCAELDIWMRSSNFCGRGFGSEAIELLVSFLLEQYHVRQFVLRPSRRNERAIRSYERAGFVQVDMSPADHMRAYGRGDYRDDVLMLREGAV
jgi:RimJ/RimL family protein N-acetyltransferase